MFQNLAFPPKKDNKSVQWQNIFNPVLSLCVFFYTFSPKTCTLIKALNCTENKHSSLYNLLLLQLKKSTNVSGSEISDDNI